VREDKLGSQFITYTIISLKYFDGLPENKKDSAYMSVLCNDTQSDKNMVENLISYI
jgi:hypothetical protein